jgi:hypothetical protein
MSVSVQREDFDIEQGYQYYVSFKPHVDLVESAGEVHSRIPVEASLSVSETGDLADLSFALPKPCRSEQALAFIRNQDTVSLLPGRVMLTVPGLSGDAVATAEANLELDLAGRIIGVEIHWKPTDTSIS